MLESLMEKLGRVVMRTPECKGKVVMRFNPRVYRAIEAVNRYGQPCMAIQRRRDGQIVCWAEIDDPFDHHSPYHVHASATRRKIRFSMYPQGVDGLFWEMCVASIMVMAPALALANVIGRSGESVTVDHVGPSPSINPYKDPVLGPLLA